MAGGILLTGIVLTSFHAGRHHRPGSRAVSSAAGPAYALKAGMFLTPFGLGDLRQPAEWWWILVAGGRWHFVFFLSFRVYQ